MSNDNVTLAEAVMGIFVFCLVAGAGVCTFLWTIVLPVIGLLYLVGWLA